MPYIKSEDRSKFDTVIEALIASVDPKDMKVGDLNYLVTRIVHKWISSDGVSYAKLNSAIGVLECAKLELYRQVAASYEDQKKNENGPVSHLDNN
jgi:hypothetical protein